MGWITGPVHDTIGSGIQHLIATFSGILLLLMWFALPILNTQGAKNVNNLITNEHLGTVTDKLVGCITLNDVVFKGINKLFISFDAIDISHLGVNSQHKEKLHQT